MQYCHNDPATAANLTSAALQKDPDIVGIFAANLFSAEGTATGVRQAGKQGRSPSSASTPDPTRSRRSKDGTVQALVAQQPETIGTVRRRRGRRRARRRHGSQESRPGFTVITKDNVDGDGAKAIYKSTC